jgi:hypothetical protein
MSISNATPENPDPMRVFQEEMSSSAGIVAVKASFLSALDFFLAASKQNNIEALQVVARALAETFYHPAFDDITIWHDVRRETLAGMATTLSNRFNESQSFLSRDHILILQKELVAVQKLAQSERSEVSHTLRNSWTSGVLLYSGGEALWRIGKALGTVIRSLPARKLKRGDRRQLADLRQEVGDSDPGPSPSESPNKRQQFKDSCKKICIRTLKVFGGFAKGAVKFSGRAAVGGGVLGIPFFLLLKPEEKHALSDKIVEKLLKPALESYKRSISRGEK